MGVSILISLTDEAISQLDELVETAPIKTNRSKLIRDLIETEYEASRGIG